MADITTKYKSKWTGAEIDDGIEKARNAVPLDGSKAMTGALNFQMVNNGSGRLQKSHNDTNDYGTILRDFDKNGNVLSITTRAALGLVGVAGSDGVLKEILHTGNKPTGVYTGNGSAESRTIDTGGIGSTCAIFGYGGFAIVTMHGTIVCNTAGVSSVSQTEAAFANGVLTLATTNDVLNHNGTTTYYQVL